MAQHEPDVADSTQLPLDESLTVHALNADGTDGWLSGTDAFPIGSLDEGLRDKSWPPGIHPPADGGEPAAESGVHVPPELSEWFQQILARTAAAGLTAFACDGNSAAP
ncbi:hypothetical protein ABZ402_17260 [Streptomyces mirabilis]|uniref:hypothetical protein n=1 Tax=Streptomyces mirabilis TaxID=68239 RepID=UPI0033E74329